MLRYGLGLAAVGLLAFVVVAWTANDIITPIYQNGTNDYCSFIDADGQDTLNTGSFVAPDPLDPDCIHGEWGGPPYVTRAEAAAAAEAAKPLPSLPYLPIGASAALAIVAVVASPYAGRRLRDVLDRLRERQ